MSNLLRTVIERKSVRAILLTPDHEILLFRIKPPDGDELFWITPGGGIEQGENVEAALRRELREELCLEHFEMGDLVWRRQHTYNWGDKRLRQNEEYYIVPIVRFEPNPSDELDMTNVVECRWWTAAELHSATERLTPLSLASIVERYLRDGPPSDSLPVEVLVDE